MTNQPDPAPKAEAARPPTRAQVDVSDLGRKRDFLPLLYLVGFIVLAGSIGYLWQHPATSAAMNEQAGRVDTLQSQIAALRAQVAQLEQRPAGAAVADVAKLQTQVNALDNRATVAPSALAALADRVAGVERRPAVSPDAVETLSNKVTALQNRPTVDPANLQQLTDRVTAMESRKVVTPEQLSLLSDQVQALGRQIPDIKPVEQKLTDLSGRVQQMQDADGKLAARLDGVEKNAAAQADQLKTLSQRAQLMARLQSMGTALAAGQKLGDVPGAPPALARFASEAPPTEAALRESFDRYAEAAQAASQPALTDKEGFGARLWTRAQQAVTVRQGDRVLVGDPIAGVLARAHEKLNNGDLAGSVDALKGLAGPAAAAMQPWTERAQALVAARSALASLAAN